MAARNIRPARPEDAAAIAALTDAAYAKYVPRIGRPPMPMTFDYARVVAEHPVWVIGAGDALTAVLYLIPRADHLLIESIAVHPDAQGMGVGRELMGFAEQEARRMGLPELRLYTNERMTGNIAFYERLGYRPTERRQEGGFARVYMARDLE